MGKSLRWKQIGEVSSSELKEPTSSMSHFKEYLMCIKYKLQLGKIKSSNFFYTVLDRVFQQNLCLDWANKLSTISSASSWSILLFIFEQTHDEIRKDRWENINPSTCTKGVWGVSSIPILSCHLLFTPRRHPDSCWSQFLSSYFCFKVCISS